MSLGNLEPVSFSYDSRGRLEAIVQGSGLEERTLGLGYDLLGRLETITDPLSRTVTFDYDAANRVVGQELPDARTISFGWDENGNLTSLTPPGQPPHGFVPNLVDQVASYAPPAVPGGGSTSYSYDLDRFLTGLLRPDFVELSFERDIQGRLREIGTPLGSYLYQYPALTADDRLTEAEAPDGGTIAYGWNGPYLMTTTWAGAVAGSVARTYDANGRIASRSVNGASTATFDYDDDGLLEQAGALAVARDAETGLVTGTTLGSVTTAMAHNSFGEPASTSASFAGTPFYEALYTRDKLGRITTKTETIDGVTSTWEYGYDLAGRLDTVERDNVLVGDYGYDDNGNRTSYSGVWGAAAGSYDAQDRMTSYGGATYTYTANGELLTKTVGADVTSYQYDVFGNLRHVELPDGTEIDYVIDAQNRRIGKRVDGVLVQGLLYKDQLEPVAELDGSGAVVARFVYGTRPHVPEYLVKGGVTYRVVSDHLGSVRLVVNATTGAVAQRIDYDEYGRVLADSNSSFQPFGFAGGIRDGDVEFVRFGWRDYDPVAGRWTVKDHIGFAGGESVLYSYNGGEPVNSTDAAGLGGCTVDFPGYPITIPGTGIEVPLNHSGVVAYDQAGGTRYYEYGRYNGPHGNVERRRVPDLEVGPDGEFTEESWQDLSDALRDGPGKGIKPLLWCRDGADAEKIIDFAERRMHDADRAPYSWNPLKPNTCVQFAQDAFSAGFQ